MKSPLELLLYACRYYSIENVQTRMAECEALGVDINDTNNSEQATPLIRACENGDLEIVEYLLQRGASVYPRDRHGYTALHRAVSKKNVALVELLLAHGADVMACNDHNETPVHLAIRSAKEVPPDMLGVLVDAGFDIHMIRDTGWGKEGYTLLHYACHHSNQAAAKVLLELGVDLNARNEWGRTALYIAAVQDYVNQPGLVELLLQHGADTTKRFSGGKRLLQLHIEKIPDVAVMQLLMNHGLDLAEAIQPERPPLHRLLENLDDLASPGLDVYQFFVANGVPINGQNDKGQTPLHVACSSDYFLVQYYTRFLLEHGAKDALFMEDANGFLPLHCAVKSIPPSSGQSWSVNAECIALLLEKGADPNAKTRDGRSALHLLLEIQSDDARDQCVRLLCSHGAVWDETCERRLEFVQRLMENPHSEGSMNATDEIVESAKRAVREWRSQVEAMTTSESQGPVLMLEGLRCCVQFWSEERSQGREDVVLSKIPREVYYNGERQVIEWLEGQGLSLMVQGVKRRKM